MISLPVEPVAKDCWNTIGVRGDRSCPELAEFVHCQNCPVFAAAGRRFLDAPSPNGYLDEWTDRLAEIPEMASCDTISALVFRLADEWLALPVHALVEVTTPRPVHRVPSGAASWTECSTSAANWTCASGSASCSASRLPARHAQGTRENPGSSSSVKGQTVGRFWRTKWTAFVATGHGNSRRSRPRWVGPPIDLLAAC